MYRGVSGVARKVKKIYRGVSGVARQVKKGYRGVSGVARQFFGNEYLYNSGSNNISLHGGFYSYLRCGFGWNYYTDGSSNYGYCTITGGASSFTVVGPSNTYGSIVTLNALNLTNYSKLVIVVDSVSLYSSGGPRVGFATTNTEGFTGSYVQIGSTGTKTLDISSLTGNHYFAMAFQNKCSITISKIYLE